MGRAHLWCRCLLQAVPSASDLPLPPLLLVEPTDAQDRLKGPVPSEAVTETGSDQLSAEWAALCWEPLIYRSTLTAVLLPCRQSWVCSVCIQHSMGP